MKGFITLMGALLLITFLGLALKNDVDFRHDCHAKGGVVVEASTEMLCVNKEAFIK
uniref:Uncharacterized protein n=2 Tax=unclassified bacterial viruses TaxID=12333 RepID=A0AAU6VYK7_9VIRU